MHLTYLDVLRHVVPFDVAGKSNISNIIHFLIFGDFDALHIYQKCKTMSDLKDFHEEEHNIVSACFDTQPVFLCSNTSQDDIFSCEEDYVSTLLVLTIFQLDKKFLAEYSSTNQYSVQGLISDFTSLLNESGNDSSIALKVFWNLGQSDILVAFRVKSLSSLAVTINKLRTEAREYNGIKIVDSSSLVAFPFFNDRKKMYDNIKLWLNGEKNANIFMMINTSANYHEPDIFDKKAELVFGEWDYLFKTKLTKKNSEKIAKILLHTLFTSPSEKCGMKTSCSIPFASLKKLDHCKNSTRKIFDDDQWIDVLANSFFEFASTVRNDLEDVYGTKTEDTAKTITSFGKALKGLAKFLYRLYVGSFEEDLYTYVKPVFGIMAKVSDDYRSKVLELLNTQENYNAISQLIGEFIEGCAGLISNLQHMFAVLAVSPHTFIETYGSNMRSLSAAGKLTGAYQGIIQFLKESFPDIIDDEGNEGAHEIFILPFRKASPVHTLFFPHSSPEQRVSCIEIDFPAMFDIHSTIYVIMHECGHHLGNRNRLRRKELLFKSSFRLTVEAFIGKFIYEPLQSLISTMNNEEIKFEASRLFIGMSNEDKHSIYIRYEKKIRENVTEAVNQISNKLILVAENENEAQYINHNEYDMHFIQDYYSVYLSDLLRGCIKSIFKRKGEKGYSDIVKSIASLLDELFIPKMLQTARELEYEIVNKNSGAAYDAVRIASSYHMQSFSERIASNASKCVLEGLDEKINALVNVFTDVFADIFAIKILGITEANEYCKILSESSGSMLSNAVINPINLMRIIAIFKACFNECEGLQKFLEGANVPSWLKDKVQETWLNVTYSTYIEPLEEYAQICADDMDNKIKNLSKNNAELEILRKIFKKGNEDKLNNEIEMIFYFWCRLLGRRLQDESK